VPPGYWWRGRAGQTSRRRICGAAGATTVEALRRSVYRGFEQHIWAGDAGPAAPRVLVLTTFDLDEYVFAALGAGASNFLLNDARPEDLLAAVRAVAAGDAMIEPSATRRWLRRCRAGREGRVCFAGGADRPGDAGAGAGGQRSYHGKIAAGLCVADLAGRRTGLGPPSSRATPPRRWWMSEFPDTRAETSVSSSCP